MKIAYVGQKASETAFSPRTEIVWEPGSVHDIKDLALVADMLKHPDVFAIADEVTAKEAPKPVEPKPEPKPEPMAEVAPIPEPEAVKADVQAEPQSAASDTGNVPNAEEQPKAEFIMQTESGPLVLDTVDKDTLRKLIDEAGLKVHHKSGEDKMRTALAEAFPVAAEKAE